MARQFTMLVLAALLATTPVLAAPQVITLGGGDVSDDPVAACGDLAASPFEPGRDGRGLLDDAVFLDGALAACEAARSAVPDSADAATWLARVYILIGRADDAVPLLEQGVAAGNALAAFLLSDRTSDEDRTAELLSQAADAGFAPAESKVAARLEADGAYVHAIELYRSASEHGDTSATYKLGYLNHYGLGLEIDYKAAGDFYQRAADAGEPLGNYGLGQMYEYAQGQEQNYAKAAEYYQLAADKREMMSETALAYLYEQALGVERDYDKSFALLTDASGQGYGYAYAALSLHYLYGEGTAVDPNKAYDLAWLAQQKSVNYAEGILGYMFSEGLGTPRDLSNALFHFQAGSAGGDQYSTDEIPIIQAEIACLDVAGSQYEPGNIGHGVEFAAIDPDTAIAACENALQFNPGNVGDGVWLARAYAKAERYADALPLLEAGMAAGNVLANVVYGDLLVGGLGVDVDPARAVELYQAAADKDFGLAQYVLAMAYASGVGVEADPAKALEWFKRALSSGVNDAEQQIALLSSVAVDGDIDLTGFGREGPGY
ncbi:MAG: tetratricopeptide repeat protein [Devosia sp.]